MLAPTRDGRGLTARQRLLKRPSIHNSKFPRMNKEGQDQAPTVHAAHGSVRRSSPPATLIIDRMSPRKRRRPEIEGYIPRVTRSQAQIQHETSKQPQAVDLTNQLTVKPTEPVPVHETKRRKLNVLTGHGEDLSKAPTQLVVTSRGKHTKLDTIVTGKDLSKEPTQIVTTSPRKLRKQHVSPRPQAEVYIDLTQSLDKPSLVVTTSPRKRRKPTAAPPQAINNGAPAASVQSRITSPAKQNRDMRGGFGNKTTLPKTAQSVSSVQRKRQELIVILRYRQPRLNDENRVFDELHQDEADIVKTSLREGTPVSPRKMTLRTHSGNTAGTGTGTRTGLSNARRETVRTDALLSPSKRGGRPANSKDSPRPSRLMSPRKARAGPQTNGSDTMLF
jgi:hypothetical protein